MKTLSNSTATLNFILMLLIAVLLCLTIQPSYASTTEHHTVTVKSRTVKTKPTHHKTTTKLKHAATQKKKAPAKISKKPIKKKSQRKIHSTHVTNAHTTPHPKPSAHAIPTAKTSINTEAVTQSKLSVNSLNAPEKSLVTFVRKTVTNMRYTAYKLGGARIDSSRGIYVVDCSRYVDHVLKTIHPQAYTSLTLWSGSTLPTTNDYYQYFTNLSSKVKHWDTIDDVEELRPGDILVFRNINRKGNETGGHVMVVMDKPTRDGNTFSVRIADSASSGHTEDTRKRHASGIGIGTMLLKVNPKTFQPYAYAWKIGAPWETRVNFAMARPVDLRIMD